MKDRKLDQKQAWLDLELFRNARAFGQGGCIIIGLLLAALMTTLLISR